jgi:hypothetical protein
VPVTFEEGGQESELHGQAAIDKYRGVIAELDRQFEDAERKIVKRYWLMKWAFMAGIAFLMVSRAYVPARDVLPTVQRFFS